MACGWECVQLTIQEDRPAADFNDRPEWNRRRVRYTSQTTRALRIRRISSPSRHAQLALGWWFAESPGPQFAKSWATGGMDHDANELGYGGDFTCDFFGSLKTEILRRATNLGESNGRNGIGAIEEVVLTESAARSRVGMPIRHTYARDLWCRGCWSVPHSRRERVDNVPSQHNVRARGCEEAPEVTRAAGTGSDASYKCRRIHRYGRGKRPGRR